MVGVDRNCIDRIKRVFLRRRWTRASLKGPGNIPSCSEESISAWTHLPVIILDAYTSQQGQGTNWQVFPLTALRILSTSSGPTGWNCFQITGQDFYLDISNGPSPCMDSNWEGIQATLSSVLQIPLHGLEDDHTNPPGPRKDWVILNGVVGWHSTDAIRAEK